LRVIDSTLAGGSWFRLEAANGQSGSSLNSHGAGPRKMDNNDHAFLHRIDDARSFAQVVIETNSRAFAGAVTPT